MTTKKDVETFIQCVQKFHSSLPASQQRMLECCLNAARQCQGSCEPDVQGYMSPGQSWTSLCDCVCNWCCDKK